LGVDEPLGGGDAVRITRGVFRNELGLYAGMKPRERIEVLLGALGRVTLLRDDVEPIR
jgi:transcription antitermination factor NusG